MLRFLFDTDHLTLFEHGHSRLIQRLTAQPLDAVGISAITLEESLRGRLAVLSKAKDGIERVRRYARLVDALYQLNQFPIAAYDKKSDDEFQRLRTIRLKIGTQDLRIAAVALAGSLTVLTRNRRDFGLIAGLKIEDWTV